MPFTASNQWPETELGTNMFLTDSRQVTRSLFLEDDPNRIIAAEVGPAFQEYRRRWDLARGFRLQLPFPLHVDYELFYACNLRCPICLMSLPPQERSLYGDSKQALSLETMKRLLSEGASRGQAAAGLNGICEPLLSPELPEIVSYARRVGLLDVMFSTNGLLLEEKISRELIAAGLTRLMISLDAATEATYARIRVGSDFRRVTENILNFLRLRREMKSRLPVVRVSFCVTSLNEHELDLFIRTWSSRVDFISIQHYGNTFTGQRASDRSRLFPEGYHYDYTQGTRCGQPWKRVMVRHNGDVIPCCDASGLALVIGNIHGGELADIWLGEKAVSLRRLHQQGRSYEEPICRRCLTKWGPPSEKAGPERRLE
ncbi:MAG: radical SAM/SPASM domain-containing protein [Thermodesulfobacteriota bacterium]